MTLHSLEIIIAVVYPLSEAGLTVFKRAKRDRAAVQDDGSIGLIWAVILVSMALSTLCRWVDATRLAMPDPLRATLLLGLVIPGLALRWLSVLTLGRFFTMNVAIHNDHRVIQTGPYRFVRHPAYAGSLLTFLGVGLASNNILSLVVILVPISLVFLLRIRAEENVLLTHLGEPYAAYCARTRRLVPGLY